MRLFRKLYRKLFCRIEIESDIDTFYVLSTYCRFLFWKKLIITTDSLQKQAQAIRDWKNGK